MVMVKKFLPILSLGLLLTGCSTTITNLTPKHETRNASGLYPVETALKSSQQTLLWHSIHPTVLVAKDIYQMKATTLMTNRWETLIPAPDTAKVIYYRFKFDYNYNSFGSPP